MEEFVCLRVRAEKDEAEADFAARLTRFWTYMLRQHQAEFEKVYAETSAFELDSGRLSRCYLAEGHAVPFLESEIRNAGFELAPIDLDDCLSKYEATAPEWMQIEH